MITWSAGLKENGKHEAHGLFEMAIAAVRSDFWSVIELRYALGRFITT
jgi:hypothetical protein